MNRMQDADNLRRYIAQNLAGIVAVPTRDHQVTAGRIANDANSRGSVPETANSYGTPINLHPDTGPNGIAGQLGGLFGSTDYSWGPSSQQTQPPPPAQSSDFDAFMNLLMQDTKDEHGRRVGTWDAELWQRVSPLLEDALQSPPDPIPANGSYFMYDPWNRFAPSYRGRQDNQFLTPEQRGEAEQQWYDAHPDYVTPNGNRMPKNISQEIQDGIRRMKLPWYKK